MEPKAKFFSKLSWDVVVNIIATVILAGCSLLWKCFAWNLIWLSVILGVVILIQAGCVIGSVIWKRVSYKSYYYPKQRVPYKYSVESLTVNYTLNERTENSQTVYDLDLSRDVTVRANVSELDRISDKYLWTGASEAKLPVKVNKVRSIQKLEDKPGVWKYFEVIFTNKIECNDVIDVSYKWPTIKDCKTASPFISTLSDVPTKKITFKINLGHDYAGKPIHLEERRSIDGDNMLSHKDYQLDSNGCIEISVSPKRFRYFIVFWEW